MNKIKLYSLEEGKCLIDSIDRRNGIIVFDFDGVVSLGIYPKSGDIICTGRPVDQAIVPTFPGVPVYYNTCTLQYRGDHDERARTLSGNHKANMIKNLILGEVNIQAIVDDDPLQIDIIKSMLDNINYSAKLILINSKIQL